jgi:diguanylate cyclase (GGDEF)-like protein
MQNQSMLPKNQPTLLIVDDSAANRTLLARRFARNGFAAIEAESGATALELIDEQTCDLVLLDVSMPELDGLEVLKRIRQQHGPMELPVVMVTSKADGSDVAKALEAGANDYLTKPVDFSAALARVKTQLERKRDKEELHKANETLRELNETLERRIDERTAELVRKNEELKNEVAERERSQAEVHYLAYHDSFTGLGNRVLLRQQLEQALSRPQRKAHTVAVLFIDLDGFKSVNDTLGHSIGDGLLKCVAQRLSEGVPERDKVARLGGDEFAVIQMDVEQPNAAAVLASRLIGMIAQPAQIEGHQLSIGASIGIAVASADNSKVEDLLKSADLAMYRAKADGRGTYRFFEPEMDAAAQARRAMELSLRAANVDNAFMVYYQPLVDLASKRVTCLEALLRWRHPEKGFIPPTQFIPLAEEIGIIVSLGEWVLRQACMDAMHWPDDIKVAVNLSPVQFKYGGLPRAVRDALSASGLPPRRLELEVTESVLLEHTENNLGILNELRDMGVAISMDDFGTGYSSLSYLRNFRFDKVKIDRAFITDLTKGNDSLAIVRAIADLGRSFGMITVAEGVETVEQLRCLEHEGCGQVQGYFFSPPRPAAQIPTIIQEIDQEIDAQRDASLVPNSSDIEPLATPNLSPLTA